MRLREEDLDKYLEQIKDPEQQAKLKAHKEEVMSLGKGELLRPDEIENETVKNLVNAHKYRFLNYLSDVNLINQFSESIDKIGPTLENPKVLEPLKAALDSYDRNDDDSRQKVGQVMSNSDLLPFFYEILKNSEKDDSIKRRSFYEEVAAITGATAKKEHPEAVDNLIAALDGPAMEGAARGLDEIGDPKAIEPLLEIARKKNDRTPGSVIRALGKFKDKRITVLFIEWLNSSKNIKLLHNVAQAAIVMHDPDLIDPLLEKATAADTDESLKTHCYQALAEYDDKRLFHPLMKELQGADPRNSQHYILKAIEKLLPQIDRLTAREFMALLRNGRFGSMEHALKEYINRLANKGEKVGLLQAALESGDEQAEDWVMDLLLEKPEITGECYKDLLPILTRMLVEKKSKTAFRVIAAQGDVESLLKFLPDYYERYEHEEQMHKLVEANMDKALPLLAKMLYEEMTVNFAVKILSKINSPEVEDIFLRVLTESPEREEEGTKEIWARRYLAGIKSKKAIPYFFDVMTARGGYENSEAMICLREIGGEEVVSHLIGFFTNLSESWNKYWGYAVKLAKELPDERLIEPLIRRYVVKSYEFGEEIIDALATYAGTGLKDKVRDALQKEMEEPGPQAILLAASVFRELNDSEIIQPLLNALAAICDTRPLGQGMGIRMAQALAGMGAQMFEEIKKKLIETKNTNNAKMRVLLLDVSCRQGKNAQDADDLIVETIDDANPEVGAHALELAGARKIGSAVEKILRTLHEIPGDQGGEAWRGIVRIKAIDALGEIGGDKATDELINLYETGGRFGFPERENTGQEHYDVPPGATRSGDVIAALAKTGNIKAVPVLIKGGNISAAVKILEETREEPKDEKIKRAVKIHKKMERHSDAIAEYLPFDREENLTFFERIIGGYSGRADAIFEGILDCLKKGVLTSDNKNELWPYLDHLKAVSPGLVSAYLEASNKNEFFADVEALTTAILNPGKDDPATKNHPLYDEIIKSIYQNNSTGWTSYEMNRQCADRTNDLKSYNIKERYVLDPGVSTDLVIKEGQKLDLGKLDPIKARFYGWSKSWAEIGYDKEKMLADIGKRIDEKYQTVKDEPWAQGADNMEQKLFALVTESIISGKLVDEVKNLLIGYQFAKYEDIRAYIQGTTDRVSNARNKDYAYLGELHTFFADQIKEISRKMLGEADQDQWMQKVLPAIFEELRAKELNEEKKETLNRMNPKKEADMVSFRKQISGILKGHKWSVAKKMVLAKRQKIAKIAAAAGNLKYTDPKRIQLGSITLEELLNTEENISLGKYNPKTFSKYMAQKLMDTFEEELQQIEGELAKFESRESKGKQVKKLNGFITKNSASANARMVGGVCVSGDIAQWNDPQYLQMAFHDPEDNTCKGLVLMHVWEQEGKKYLVASLNPSSTYLYGVDEKGIFDQICVQLVDFASANGISGVGFSTHKNIRTNRTGGEFENAMNKKIADAKGKYQKQADLTFSENRRFSTNPQYVVDDVDLIWVAD